MLLHGCAENEELHKQTFQLEDEASRLRLELKTVQLERSSLHSQLEESRRRLELQTQQQERLKALSRDQLLEAQLSERQAELELAHARLEHLQRYLEVSRSQQQKASEKSEELARTAGDATVHKVERLQEQLVSEQLQSERLAERERALEAQLRDAELKADSLRNENQRVCAELKAMRREKSSLEAKFSAVAVQLAESEAAKQRLHRQKTLTSGEEGRRLREENRCLEQELVRLRHQLSRTVDAMFAPQPRTSTPKKREAPDGQSLHRGPDAPTFRTHQLEAHLRTTLQLDVSRGSHVDADQSSQWSRPDQTQEQPNLFSQLTQEHRPRVDVLLSSLGTKAQTGHRDSTGHCPSSPRNTGLGRWTAWLVRDESLDQAAQAGDMAAPSAPGTGSSSSIAHQNNHAD
ncbi:hypothetical protein HPB49_002709 [Dermacentor silvarum]|uniref:Uncharacterized protein n=1 Tax=Dermacentor silvarum TaxID=543639 RepID=A0ACB8D9S4_DERSI|nr:hypothetical protein HPB49_002709 [Dermacentor silvarum]